MAGEIRIPTLEEWAYLLVLTTSKLWGLIKVWKLVATQVFDDLNTGFCSCSGFGVIASLVLCRISTTLIKQGPACVDPPCRCHRKGPKVNPKP